MSFLRYGLGKFRCCIWKEKFASVYQSTLAWYGQVWCFSDESPKIHGRRNKFRGCPCTRVHQLRMTEQFTRAWMLLGGCVTVPRSRNFSDCWTSPLSCIAVSNTSTVLSLEPPSVVRSLYTSKSARSVLVTSITVSLLWSDTSCGMVCCNRNTSNPSWHLSELEVLLLNACCLHNRWMIDPLHEKLHTIP